MTAELVVMNKIALCMAADSAVTIESYDRHGPTEKVFNSALKLFSLSKHHPVALMFYNSVELGGLPMEVITKQFRKHLGSTECDSLYDYCDRLISFVDSNKSMFPDAREAEVIKRIVFRHAFDVRQFGNNSKDRRNEIDRLIQHQANESYSTNFDDKFARICKRIYKPLIDGIFDMVFSSIPSKGLKAAFLESAILLLTRSSNIPNYSGVVIGGFGKGDMLPKMRQYTFDTMVCGRLKYKHEKDVEVDERNPSSIVTVAQSDVVQTVLEGVDPDYSLKFYREAVEMLKNAAAEIINNISELDKQTKDKYIKASSTSFTKEFQDFVRQMNDHRRTNHTYPILSAIAAMPLGELAAVAETMINVTHMKRRMSLRTETVGGPIDIAIISKGDGLIWIKRKHYFDPDLNRPYFTRYFDS